MKKDSDFDTLIDSTCTLAVERILQIIKSKGNTQVIVRRACRDEKFNQFLTQTAQLLLIELLLIIETRDVVKRA